MSEKPLLAAPQQGRRVRCQIQGLFWLTWVLLLAGG
jgi:hypothetical protein